MEKIVSFGPEGAKGARGERGAQAQQERREETGPGTGPTRKTAAPGALGGRKPLAEGRADEPKGKPSFRSRLPGPPAEAYREAEFLKKMMEASRAKFGIDLHEFGMRDRGTVPVFYRGAVLAANPAEIIREYYRTHFAGRGYDEGETAAMAGHLVSMLANGDGLAGARMAAIQKAAVQRLANSGKMGETAARVEERGRGEPKTAPQDQKSAKSEPDSVPSDYWKARPFVQALDENMRNQHAHGIAQAGLAEKIKVEMQWEGRRLQMRWAYRLGRIGYQIGFDRRLWGSKAAAKSYLIGILDGLEAGEAKARAEKQHMGQWLKRESANAARRASEDEWYGPETSGRPRAYKFGKGDGTAPDRPEAE